MKYVGYLDDDGIRILELTVFNSTFVFSADRKTNSLKSLRVFSRFATSTFSIVVSSFPVSRINASEELVVKSVIVKL